MRDLNEIQTFIDEDEFDDDNATAVDLHSAHDYLNISNRKCQNQSSDSGIVYDPDEKSASKFSINSCGHHGSSLTHRNITMLKGKELNDSGINSISKIPSIREFHSKHSLSKISIKSSSVSTVAMPMRDTARTASKIRSKRYSLPDIDKLKLYSDTKSSKKPMADNRKTACDMKPETQAVALPLGANETINVAVTKTESFIIDPKLINKYDGLSQSLYYIDENGSPKIRERYIKQQRMVIEKQEQKRREKEARSERETTSCSCFNFTRLSKKLKELCKFIAIFSCITHSKSTIGLARKAQQKSGFTPKKKDSLIEILCKIKFANIFKCAENFRRHKIPEEILLILLKMFSRCIRVNCIKIVFFPYHKILFFLIYYFCDIFKRLINFKVTCYQFVDSSSSSHTSEENKLIMIILCFFFFLLFIIVQI